MQTAESRGIGMLKVLKNVFRNEGIPQNILNSGFWALYNGLSASLLRQGSYSTVRFGVYEALKERYAQPGTPLPLGKLILMASVSGWFSLPDVLT